MFEFYFDAKAYNKVHFIGIGGISMSGMAEILLSKGYQVSGTDNSDSHIVGHLRDLGAKIYIGHSPSNIGDADLIIFTDAIAPDNVELIAARESGACVIDRASFLGSLMRNYRNSIAVSGTHGKTTTTSMIATIINNPQMNPTILLGGELDSIGGNVKLGTNEFLLTEACEYKANILKYHPSMAIILNIDEDHLDFFKSIDHITDTFREFVDNLTERDVLIANNDDEHVRLLAGACRGKVVTIGIDSDADFMAKNISFDSLGYPSFDLYAEGSFESSLKLGVMGKHNVYNALAAIAASYSMGVDRDLVLEKISSYGGVHRRLELKGFMGNVRIIDDYAHHPTEIKASLNAIRNSTDEKVFCIFQPHTFTRTKILLDSFSEAFSDADRVIIADIYAARELDNGEIHSRDLAELIRRRGYEAVYLGSFDEIEEYILREASNHDTVITMGAGNIYQVGTNLLNRFSADSQKAI